MTLPSRSSLENDMIGQPSTPVEREKVAPRKVVAFLGLLEKQTRVYVPHSQFPPNEGGFC